MTKPKHKRNETDPHAAWATPAAQDFAIEQLRADLALHPPRLRRERLDHVRQLLAREAARGNPGRSALAQLAPSAYGISSRLRSAAISG